MSDGVINTGQMFAGMQQAAVKAGGGRLPSPALGTAWYMIESVSLKVSQKDSKMFVPIDYKCVHAVCDRDKRPSTSEAFTGEQVGTRVSDVYFAGTYFAADMKKFIMTIMGLTTDAQINDMINSTIPDMQKEAAAGTFNAMEGQDDMDNAWKYISDRVTGNTPNAQCGCFDGNVVIELNTVAKTVPNKEGTGKMVDGVFVPDPPKTYTNVYPERRVTFSEVKNALGGDADKVALLFGSVEALDQLVAAEA